MRTALNVAPARGRLAGGSLAAGVPAALILSWLFAGCAFNAGDPWSAASQGRPIIGGTADSDPAHGAVVALTFGPGTEVFCTATLISPRVVVTAAHCLEGLDPGEVWVMFGDSIYPGGSYRSVSEMQPHPGYDYQFVTADIGLIRLTQDAPAEVAPISPLPSSMGLTSTDDGSPVVFSGFGITEQDEGGTRLQVSGAIGKVCAGPDQCTYSGAYVVARSFAYSQASGGPCSGDSGGPALIMRGGQEYVAGVTSYGDLDCSLYGVSTMVDPYEAWIDAFTRGITTEQCDNQVDDDGDGFIDCDDSDCIGEAVCQASTACGAAEIIGCGGQVSGSTLGGPTAYVTYSCLQDGAEQGPERAFRVEAPAGTFVRATMTPLGGGDLDLFLLPALGAGCDPDGCLGASLSSGSSPEELTATLPDGAAFLVVDTYDTPGPFSLTLTCPEAPEQCDDGVDNDGDGLVDCEDPDCEESHPCQDGQEICGNGLDDDGDGLVDCADPGCEADPACQTDSGDPAGCGCSQPGSGQGFPQLLALALLLGAWIRTRARSSCSD